MGPSLLSSQRRAPGSLTGHEIGGFMEAYFLLLVQIFGEEESCAKPLLAGKEEHGVFLVTLLPFFFKCIFE